MEITKKFRFESSHIVRKASSDRCRKSIHGHSYLVEVTMQGSDLTDGDMLIDFIDLKPIKELIDALDHSHILGSIDVNEHGDFVEMILKNSERVVILPCNPTAEGIAMILLAIVNSMVELGIVGDRSGDLSVKSVKVHETVTGSATVYLTDLSTVSRFKEITLKSVSLINVHFTTSDFLSHALSQVNNNLHSIYGKE